MKLGKGWIVVVVLVGLLLAGLSTAVLAQTPNDATKGGQGNSWEEMYTYCHGAEGGDGGMMGEAGTGMSWGPGGMMGGWQGGDTTGSYGTGGWGGMMSQ